MLLSMQTRTMSLEGSIALSIKVKDAYALCPGLPLSEWISGKLLHMYKNHTVLYASNNPSPETKQESQMSTVSEK